MSKQPRDTKRKSGKAGNKPTESRELQFRPRPDYTNQVSAIRGFMSLDFATRQRMLSQARTIYHTEALVCDGNYPNPIFYNYASWHVLPNLIVEHLIEQGTGNHIIRPVSKQTFRRYMLRTVLTEAHIFLNEEQTNPYRDQAKYLSILN